MSGNIKSITADLTDSFVKDLQAQIARQVQADVAQKLAQIDIAGTVKYYVDAALKNYIKNVDFPSGSIPGTAINLQSLVVSGDNVLGGTHKGFQSTGIQDAATDCKVTILDEHTVVENNLLAASAEIKGNLTVDGDFILRGEVPTDSPFYRELLEHSAGLVKMSLDEAFFEQYSHKVFEKIKETGIDLTKISVAGRELVSDNKLGLFVTESNLQTLGELRSLVVAGSSSLADTLTVVKKRVGINTEEPSAALSVWDDECEIVTHKLRKDVACVRTTRNQSLVLGSNGKENLTLGTDGSVTLSVMKLGQVTMTASDDRPSYLSSPGVIVWNSQPKVGSPIGWVSLGGANWGSISTIS